MPRRQENDPMYSLRVYARFSGQFFFTFSYKKIVMGKKIVVPCLDVIRIAFSRGIYNEVLFLPEKRM